MLDQQHQADASTWPTPVRIAKVVIAYLTTMYAYASFLFHIQTREPAREVLRGHFLVPLPDEMNLYKTVASMIINHSLPPSTTSLQKCLRSY